jgi:hypothetical protein
MVQTLSLALRHRGAEGEPLPSGFQALEKLGAKHRRGQVSLIAAAPGSGKSAYSTHYAIKARVPTLYFSPDSDRLTLGSRAVAGVVNAPLQQVEIALEEDDEQLLELLSDATDHIWFSFAAAPSLRDIKEEIECYAYINGEWPHLVILDNLKDVASDGSDQERYHETIDFLHQLARDTSAHVLVLHHVTGQYENGTEVIPLSGLLNKVGKSPRLVLTLYRPQLGVMGIAIVKNSTGVANANGELVVNVGWTPERSWFSE